MTCPKFATMDASARRKAAGVVTHTLESSVTLIWAKVASATVDFIRLCPAMTDKRT